MTVATDELDEAVQTMLATVTGKECYVIEIPEKPETPYIILYPLVQPRGGGSWANPEEDRDVVYQVTSVGVDRRQVRWVQGKVEEGFLNRAGGGGYQYPITPASGAGVQWRLSDSLGAIVRSGDELFKADDTYRVRIGR